MLKGKRLIIGLAVLSLVLFLSNQKLARSGQEPSLEDQIEEAVAKGLNFLANQQNADGSWGFSEKVGRTGLILLKFEDRAIDLGYSPLDPDYEYSEIVSLGLDFLISRMTTQTIGVQPAGNPDGDGDGNGVYFADSYGHSIYGTGITMMALAASGDPATYGDYLQDALDWMAWAQADDYCGNHRGGWRYQPDCSSDNSNSGYATLGLGFASAQPPFGFALTIPQFVKDELSIWIDFMQDDVNGDPNDGGSIYAPGYSIPWVNILKTGNLLYEMALVGDDLETQRVKDAIDYIERHWTDPGWYLYDTGWINNRQAMFTMMKGFEAFGIKYIDLDNDGVAEHDWFEEVALHLIATQNADGSWPRDYWDYYSPYTMTTAWALLTLEKAVPAIEIPVFIDIKPESCPNALGRKNRGVLPLSITGTADFDVTMIDPASVVLTREGYEASVAPLRWSLEDVATPYEGEEECGCHTLGFDGIMDLSLKFDMVEVINALGLDAESVGTDVPLIVKGNLKEEEGGTPIRGMDCVRIVR